MPDTKDPRVRVEQKKNSMASVLSRRMGCGMPRARSRLSWKATSRSVSISSLVQSSKVMRSRPRKLVCTCVRPLVSLLDGAQDERQQRHAHHHSIERLDPVALVPRLVDVGGELVHPGEGM